MSSFHQRVWNHLEKPELGFMRTFSDAVYNNETKHPGLLPDLRHCQTILVGSDYGGQHNGVRYQSLSFILREENFPKDRAFLIPKQDVPEKTKEIANWFADHTQRLKRVVYILDEEPEKKHLRSTVMHFWGTRDL